MIHTICEQLDTPHCKLSRSVLELLKLVAPIGTLVKMNHWVESYLHRDLIS